MNDFFTVFRYEYFGYIKSRTYIVITVVLLILAIGVSFVPTVVGLIDKPGTDGEVLESVWTKTAAIIDTTGLFPIEKLPEGYAGYLFELTEDKNDAMERLLKDELSFIVEITDAQSFNLFVGKMDLSRLDLMSTAGNALSEANKAAYLEAKGLSAEEISDFQNMRFNGELITMASSDPDGDGGSDGSSYMQKVIYAYVLLFVLYITLLMYGQYIVISIVSEKSSKAMELLITSTKPMNLMFGKVLGVGAAGLTQFLLMIISAFASYKINSILWVKMNITGAEGISSILTSFMSPVSPSIIIYLTIFFVFGFFIYAFLYAAFASTAIRMEEANTVSVVPMMFIIASFLIAMLGLANPNQLLVIVCSYIPFMSPMVMFMRICTDSVSNLGAIVSVVILGLSIFVTGFLSAKIYRVCILMYGKPLKPLDIIKLFIKVRV